jgi:hypothetical protein
MVGSPDSKRSWCWSFQEMILRRQLLVPQQLIQCRRRSRRPHLELEAKVIQYPDQFADSYFLYSPRFDLTDSCSAHTQGQCHCFLRDLPAFTFFTNFFPNFKKHVCILLKTNLLFNQYLFYIENIYHYSHKVLFGRQLMPSVGNNRESFHPETPDVKRAVSNSATRIFLS